MDYQKIVQENSECIQKAFSRVTLKHFQNRKMNSRKVLQRDSQKVFKKNSQKAFQRKPNMYSKTNPRRYLKIFPKAFKKRIPRRYLIGLNWAGILLLLIKWVIELWSTPVHQLKLNDRDWGKYYSTSCDTRAAHGFSHLSCSLSTRFSPTFV